MAATGIPVESCWKNLLQECAQKSSMPLPVYETSNDGPPYPPLFRSKVMVDGVWYTSPNRFSTRKMAEQDVSKHALIGFQEKLKAEGRSHIFEEITFCKSIINEYAVKLNMEMPIYFTNESKTPLPIFVSSLQLNGVTFTGDASRNKKDAERSAARAAISSILVSEPGTTMSEIIKSKFKLYNSLKQALDSSRNHASAAVDANGIQTSVAMDSSGIQSSIAMDSSGIQASATMDSSIIQSSAAMDSSIIQSSAALHSSIVQASTAMDSSGTQISAALCSSIIQASTAMDLSIVQASAAMDSLGMQQTAVVDSSIVLASTVTDSSSNPVSDVKDSTSIPAYVVKDAISSPACPVNNYSNISACTVKESLNIPPLIVKDSSNIQANIVATGVAPYIVKDAINSPAYPVKNSSNILACALEESLSVPPCIVKDSSNIRANIVATGVAPPDTEVVSSSPLIKEVDIGIDALKDTLTTIGQPSFASFPSLQLALPESASAQPSQSQSAHQSFHVFKKPETVFSVETVSPIVFVPPATKQALESSPVCTTSGKKRRKNKKARKA